MRNSSPTALDELRDTYAGRLELEHVDITAPEQVEALRAHGPVTSGAEETTADVTTEEFTRLMVTNPPSPMRVVESLGHLIEADGTIAIMSSGQGSVANNERGTLTE